MNGAAIFATVAAAHALAVASPGPDFAMVTRQSLRHGRSAGLWTAAGIGSGIVFHVGYALFGLAWVVARYPQFLAAVTWLGAAFLLYMGAGALRAQPMAMQPAAADGAEAAGWARSFAIGLATNVFNPKATLFFVALFTAVVAGPISPMLKLALGLWLPVMTFAWFALVALLLSRQDLRARLAASAYRIDRAMGAILVLLAFGMIASRF